MAILALIRHGQSEWNKENRFTGWADPDLSEEGVAQARLAGQLLEALDQRFDHAYASMLKRAIRTLWITLEEMDLHWLPQALSWRLNERHYGALQGLNKDEVVAEHGEEQVRKWRRSYDVAPPPLPEEDGRHPRWDRRFRGFDPSGLPNGESLEQTLDRVLPFWESAMAPKLRQGNNIIVCAHGNSIRALVKHLFHMRGERVAAVEIPTGNPLLLHFIDSDLKIVAARYLDAKRAETIPPLPTH